MASGRTSKLRRGTACYVYGVLPASVNLDLRKFVPMGTSPMKCLRGGKLQALVDVVSREEFNDAEIQARDLRWIAEKVQHHNRIAQLAAATAAFVPFRFCTVLKDEASILKLLASNEEVFLTAFAKLEGKSEWGVRITCNGNKRDAVQGKTHTQEGQSGKAYLLRKQRELRATEQMEQRMRSYAETCHRELEQLASAVNRLPGDNYGSASGARSIFSASYLIVDSEAPAFRQRVARLAGEYSPLGINLHLTGPWPAYSFTDLELSPTRISA